MATIERTYVVPLRRFWLRAPLYRRAKKAMLGLREFLTHHMKPEELLIGGKLNEAIWQHGIQNPPCKLKITVTKDEKGVVKAELFGHQYVEKKAAVKKAKTAPGLAGKLQEKLGGMKESKADKAEGDAEEKSEKKAEKKEEHKDEKKDAKPKAPVKKTE